MNKTLLALTFICGMHSQCLSSTILGSLGFTSSAVKTAPEKVATPAACKTLFADPGTCVTESDVTAYLKKQQDALFARTAIKAKVKSVLDSIKGSLTDTAQKDKITKINDALDAAHTPCFQALDTLQMGAACVAASGKATTLTTSGTNNLTVLVTDEVKAQLDMCLPWFDALCLVGAGVSISQEVVLTDALFRKNATVYETPCKALKAAYSCGTSCAERTRILAEDLKPLVYDFWPESTFWSNILDSFKNIASKTTEWFKNTFSRRLLGSTSF